jgi:plastocyanin
MFTNRSRFWLAMITGFVLLTLSLGCSKKHDEADDEESTEDDTTAAVTYKPSGNEGTITGKVSLTGTPTAAVAPKPIDMSSEGSCATGNPNPMTETVVVKDGKLANVFVYIKDGTTASGQKIANLAFPVPTTEVNLDQKGCHYKPHVLGIQTGQSLKVTNSDTATHNVHPQPSAASGNEEWNQTQTGGGAPIVKTFKRQEVVIPVKCNQHNWMKSYVGVLKHPFYAVTNEDGTFEIKNVPPGTYTVETWQESYKTKSQQVTVPAKGSAAADFTYDAGATAAELREGSLKMMPALEFPMSTSSNH